MEILLNKYKRYENKINDIVKKIEDADAIVIGIGAGMTASGGINYMDEKTVERLFPEYYKLGFVSRCRCFKRKSSRAV